MSTFVLHRYYIHSGMLNSDNHNEKGYEIAFIPFARFLKEISVL